MQIRLDVFARPRLLSASAAVAAALYMAAPSPALSDPMYTYDISPSIDLPCSPGNCVYGNPSTHTADVISGTFTESVAGPTYTLDSVDLTVTGPYKPGAYNMVAIDYPSTSTEITACTGGTSCTTYADILRIYFQDPLSGSSDPVIDVAWDGAHDAVPTDSAHTSPSRSPLRSQSSVPVLPGQLGCAGVRRPRKLMANKFSNPARSA